MSIRQDLHMHTVFSDGKATPEEMILSAVNKGMTVVGISDHSYTEFDLSYCMKKEDEEKYLKELMRLKEKYAGTIAVKAGIEQDFYSDNTVLLYDYKIGSVHYLYKNGVYMPVDSASDRASGVKMLFDRAEELFDGDIYALAECYFETVGQVIEKTGADIIGHFDLIAKFNEYHEAFDENNERYITAGIKAIDRLLKTGKPFEINSGAVTRGYKTGFYPSDFFMKYIAQKGGTFVFSSDSHAPQNIIFGFDKMSEIENIKAVDLF